MINVQNLSHSYGKDGAYAVSNISFHVEKGEIFGFLGPSGAGKSTTQNILTGLLQLQKGSAHIDGENIQNQSETMFNQMGVSFEQPNVYKKLTGLENLEFHARLYSVPTEDPKTLMKMVGLEDAMYKRAGTYSKGMLQRLVFIRSMINRPKVWFLDEPTSGLDPVTAARVKEIIRQQRDRGATIFLTTHNMHIADALCDRVAFLNEGEIAALDSPRSLKLKHGQRLVNVEYQSNGQVVKERLSMNDPQERTRLQNLVATGAFDTMHSQEATLEDIFIKLTGRGLD